MGTTKEIKTNQAGATIISTTGGDNVIQAAIPYYITFAISLPNLSLKGGNSCPYIWVYSKQPKEELGVFPEWKVIDKGTSNKIKLPVSEKGQYRLYVREPKTTHKIGDIFALPYHMETGLFSDTMTKAYPALDYDLTAKQDNTRVVVPHNLKPKALSLPIGKPNNVDFANRSSYPVQPLFTIDVTETTNGLEIKTLYPIEYPSRPNNGQKLGYPITNKTYQLTNKDTFKSPLDLKVYVVTYQLWGDACQTYGQNHPYIKASSFSEALKGLYGGNISSEIVGNQATLHGFTFTFKDGSQERKLIVQNNATENARSINSFKSKDKMTSLEAIRKTHPSVLEYWLTIMQELNMVSSTISSAWRPAIGSIYHRYSLGLDINKFIVSTNPGNSKMVEVLLTRESSAGQACEPVKVSELNDKTSTKKVLTTKLFAYLAKDTLSSTRQFNLYGNTLKFGNTKPLLGWLGAPWPRTYKDLGIDKAGLAINTNHDHRHHLHITLKDDLV